MKLLWRLDNVVVFAAGANFETDPCFEGVVTDKNATQWVWKAWPTPQGYAVECLLLTGRRKLHQGSTFNLELEVAACINS